MTTITTIPGVDVAAFQGPPGTWQQAAGRVKWVAVKITELQPDGFRYVNPDAAADWAYAANELLGRIAYLFAHPSTSPAGTVSFFAEVLDPLGVEDGDVIAIDLETTDGLTPAQVDAWAAEVARLLHARYGRVAVLYTYLSFAEEGNTASLGHLPLWISEPSSPPGQPIVPAPWTTWAIHQYQTGGVIDRDLAKFPTVAAMRRALGRPPPTPPEETLKYIQSVTLHAPAEVTPNGEPVSLIWQPAAGKPSLLNQSGMGAIPGAGACLSAVNLEVRDGSKVRVTLAEMQPHGKPGLPVDMDFSPAGGFTQFTAPFDAQSGAEYEITVTNYGPIPARIVSGRWDLLR